MRVGVVDMGSNSTRLLIADVPGGGAVREVQRRTQVTRLGDGVDASGALTSAAQARVLGVVEGYAAEIAAHGCERVAAVMTSAVRDAGNGEAFATAVRSRSGLQARILGGEEEARLTFLGATAMRAGDGPPLLVIDIGGGSTELVVGQGRRVDFHVSTQAGVVRHTERHLRSDPPAATELEALSGDVREVLSAAVPAGVRESVGAAVAVAGTATSCAAIELALDPYDPERVEGHVLTREQLVTIRARLSALTTAERREVTGLHPDRAPTIVAGTILLLEAMDVFDLGTCEVSERDILWGAALDIAPET